MLVVACDRSEAVEATEETERRRWWEEGRGHSELVEVVGGDGRDEVAGVKEGGEEEEEEESIMCREEEQETREDGRGRREGGAG